MQTDIFTTEVSRHIWESKYRFRDGDVIHDVTIEDTWRRVAHALASVEPKDQQQWETRFYHVLEDFRFLPGGRILAGAGTGREVTLFNCFVMGMIDDSMDGIFDALKEGALTMQQGGGVGYDFSTLRPMGTPAQRVGGIASGPVSFMHIWDSMCGTLLSTGARRGAMMAVLRCDHPDIEKFIAVKSDPRELRHFNLSVLITDDFMQAVDNDSDWPLVFPVDHLGETKPAYNTIEKRWSGMSTPAPCAIMRTVRARELWERIMQATYEYAEPGVLFIDRINNLNNLSYREQISATNPCGEIPLPPYGACNLGSINLTRFIHAPFSEQARLDFNSIEQTITITARMLDNVTDLSHFPLPAQQQQAQGSRRIGLGLTGLADTLIMLGIRYGDDAAYKLATDVMQTICYTAYRTSIELSQEKGRFPYFDNTPYIKGNFIQSLPKDIQVGINDHGIRNSHLTAIAPTGTISLLANNVTSSLEPVFDFHYQRRILQSDGQYRSHDLTDYAMQQWRVKHEGEERPSTFIDAHDLSPQDHLKIQAAIQPYVDNAISKTINIPADFDYAEFKSLYKQAYDMGLKGCTTFRPNPVTGSVLSTQDETIAIAHCCSIERETD